MNSTLFLLSVLEIVVALVLAVTIFFVSFKMLKRFFFKEQEFKDNNTAFAIFSSGVFISIGIILSELVPSITNVVRMAVIQAEGISTGQIITYAGLSLLIGFVMAVLINVAVYLLFSGLTKGINEFAEIKNNNVSVAVVMASVLIAITLIVKNSIAVLISALVPFPEISNFL